MRQHPCLFGSPGFPGLDLNQAKFVTIRRNRTELIRTASGEVTMAETTKLSVEKALNKLREADLQKSKTTRTNEEIAQLDEETKRMRAQRQRLERHQRRSTKKD
jgi:hypothetical protein